LRLNIHFVFSPNVSPYHLRQKKENFLFGGRREVFSPAAETLPPLSKRSAEKKTKCLKRSESNEAKSNRREAIAADLSGAAVD
jgi:hypothetical protein